MQRLIIATIALLGLTLVPGTASAKYVCHCHKVHHHHHLAYKLPRIVYLTAFSPDVPYYYYSPYTVVASVLVHTPTLIGPVVK